MKSKLCSFLFVALFFFCTGLFFNFQSNIGSITMDMVRQAGMLVGLDFTNTEIDSMMQDLESSRENYEAIRKWSIPNEVSPALVFNPIPAGFQIENEQKQISYSHPGTVKLPKDKNDLAFFYSQAIG